MGPPIIIQKEEITLPTLKGMDKEIKARLAEVYTKAIVAVNEKLNNDAIDYVKKMNLYRRDLNKLNAMMQKESYPGYLEINIASAEYKINRGWPEKKNQTHNPLFANGTETHFNRRVKELEDNRKKLGIDTITYLNQLVEIVNDALKHGISINYVLTFTANVDKYIAKLEEAKQNFVVNNSLFLHAKLVGKEMVTPFWIDTGHKKVAQIMVGILQGEIGVILPKGKQIVDAAEVVVPKEPLRLPLEIVQDGSKLICKWNERIKLAPVPVEFDFSKEEPIL